MPQVRLQRSIAAPPSRVFGAVAHIEKFAKIQPQIVGVEFLSPQRHGVGTRFRETRVMGKREASTVLEVTEYVEDQRVRLVTDAGGTTWDTIFDVSPGNVGGTDLRMTMDARPHKMLSRLISPLIMGVVSKAIAADMDRVKAWCESAGDQSAPGS